MYMYMYIYNISGRYPTESHTSSGSERDLYLISASEALPVPPALRPEQRLKT